MVVIKLSKTACTVCLFVTAIIWGLAFTAQRLGADCMGAFTFNGARFLLGAVSLIPVIYLFERDQGTSKEEFYTVMAGIGGGVILFSAASLQQFGVEWTGSAGRSGFITGLYTVLVPILGIFLGRRAGLLVWAGAVCAVFGLFLLSVPSEGPIMAGDIVLFIGSFFWAWHIVYVGSLVSRIKPILFSMAQFAVCGILSLICAFLFEDITISLLSAGLMPILYSGFLSVGIAYTLQIVGQKGVEPAKAAIIFTLETLFSIVGGALLLGETMDVRGYAGCVFIFAGIIISQITMKSLDRDKYP